MKPNIQELLFMAEVAERRGVFMNDWFCKNPSDPECGTVGCLVGTWVIERDLSFQLESREAREPARRKLGLTLNEFNWLFVARPRFKGPSCIHYRFLKEVTTEQAVARLRKFIYYKLKQAEIHKAWNERQHTRGAVCENQQFVPKLAKIA